MTLIEHLQTVRDYRTQPVYPLWIILVLVLMATMSGYTGYRPTAAFVHRHQAELLSLLGFSHKRLPSLSTLRRIMVRLDFNALTDRFNQWANEHCPTDSGEQVAMDGKCLRASLKDCDQSYQDFVSFVSAFNVQQGYVVAITPMQNREQSEILTVQTLIQQLQLTEVCISCDALHTQKKPLTLSKTAAMII